MVTVKRSGVVKLSEVSSRQEINLNIQNLDFCLEVDALQRVSSRFTGAECSDRVTDPENFFSPDATLLNKAYQ
jgi:hypothetical protein